MKKLPYRVRTKTGDRFDIDFPLHPETGDAVRVGQLISLLLEAIDSDIVLAGEASNGDVLQAVAMVLAIRAGMIHSPHESVDRLATELVARAMQAVGETPRQIPQTGHA
jgi:hypothetical protein